MRKSGVASWRTALMMTVLHIFLALASFWLVSGTLLNFSKHPHWYIRGWDFPRMLVACLAGVVGLPYALLFDRWYDLVLQAGLLFTIVRQLYMIFPYTPLARKTVKQSSQPAGDDSFRLVISNVLMENTEHQRWMSVVRGVDPDVIVAVEVDDAWDQALAGLRSDYPHVVRRPQGNYYGIAIYSRLPFDEAPDVRFLVQKDVPSVRLMLRLRDGQRVRLHALHPRPPEPLDDQDSAPRDAELVLLGKEIGAHERDVPTVVCGDLNDVAWSYTSQLFLRLSRLLDPRRGRGPYNSYNANRRLFRFPLDHVFHSDEFKLLDLRVLPHVGSDHFPVFIELSCQPEKARSQQAESTPKASDHEEAEEILDKQAEREVEGEGEGHVSRTKVGAGGGARHGR